MKPQNRALHICRHCQATVYIETIQAKQPPCPGCGRICYDRIDMPDDMQSRHLHLYAMYPEEQL